MIERSIELAEGWELATHCIGGSEHQPVLADSGDPRLDEGESLALFCNYCGERMWQIRDSWTATLAPYGYVSIRRFTIREDAW